MNNDMFFSGIFRVILESVTRRGGCQKYRDFLLIISNLQVEFSILNPFFCKFFI
jgi:hypothetical protein